MKGIIGFLARRYIAGTERFEALEVAERLNRTGITATIDNLGENVKDEEEASFTVKEYHALLDEIDANGADATVSMKFTHLGLDISTELAKRNATEIIKKAAGYGYSVCIDMEGSAYTARTVDTFLDIHSDHPNCAIAIQSYLYRSEKDVQRLIEAKAGVRLVKGAYKEPPDIAFKDKKDVDANYERLMKELLLKGNYPMIATHDERLIEEAKKFAAENNIPKSTFEFQMLLGIKRKLQKSLAAEGWRVRVYVPYGVNWLPYMLRRLRERKENVFFVLRNLWG